MRDNDQTVTLSLRIPKALHTAVRTIADREVSSFNREVIIALRAHVDANRKGGR